MRETKVEVGIKNTRTVFYDEGPLSLSFGEAGVFQLGVPREIPSYLANVLLRKGLVKEYKIKGEGGLENATAR